MEHKSLAAALSAFQAELPTIKKGNTAKIVTKTGQNFGYAYADLTDVTEKAFPLLTKHGLSFLATPTMMGELFVLHYELRHVSGDIVDGDYPLPRQGTPQEMGSAITYARRYALTAVTGIAPGGDDDDAKAATIKASVQSWEPPRGPAAKPDTAW